jgi:hypothetical protein
LTGSPVFAQVLPPLDIHARYEEDLIADVLAEQHLVPDKTPLGKRIERIVVAPQDIFLPRFDPVPAFFNILHVTTKPDVVRRELLFGEGEIIGEDTIEESERNLRSLFVLAVARIVTARGSTPDSVVVVVVTKDLWTLRPNTNFVYENGNLDLLQFTLAEHNLAGRNKFLGLNFRLDPATFTLGQHYIDPRVWGSRIAAEEQVLVIFNRDSGDPEGTIALANASRPLFSLATEWGWYAGVYYEDDVSRRFINGATAPQYTYDQRFVSGALDGKRSFGRAWKSIFTLGYSANTARFRPHATTDPMILPFSEDVANIYLRYDFYQPRYVTFQDIQAYALTEDYRLGPQSTVELDLAASELGFSSDFFRAFASVAWRWLLGDDDLFYVGASGEARYEPHFSNPQHWTTPWVNRAFSATIHNISPRWWILRFLARASVTLHDYDLSNAVLQLGGTSGLRGFAAGTFNGANLYVFNLEARTKPIALWTVYFGLVGFYDGGAAYFSRYGEPALEEVGTVLRPVSYHHDAGFGLRIQLPQFNHEAVRVDMAFPLEASPDPVVVTAAFGQVF